MKCFGGPAHGSSYSSPHQTIVIQTLDSGGLSWKDLSSKPTALIQSTTSTYHARRAKVGNKTVEFWLYGG